MIFQSKIAILTRLMTTALMLTSMVFVCQPATPCFSQEEQASAASGPVPDDVTGAATETSPADEYADIMDDWNDDEPQTDIWDPAEPLNRYIFTFNDRLYFWGLKPVATVYSKIIPEPLRIGMENGWENLSAPARFANCLLQLRFKQAGIEAARFFINTVLGIGGLGDPAERMFDLQPVTADLGQTLGKWGVGFGPYIVLPFIGPSSPRDAIGMAGDSYLTPLNYYIGSFWQGAAIRAGREVNRRSLRLGEYEDFKAASLDPYVAVRSAYIQFRENIISKSGSHPDSVTFR